MTTFQYTITLNDSEYIALENLLNNAISSELAEKLGQPQPKQKYVHTQYCETIYKKLRASCKDAVISSTSSACGQKD